MNPPLSAPVPPVSGRSLRLARVLLCGSLLLGGCEDRPPEQPGIEHVAREDKGDVFNFQSGDPGMDSAIVHARATLATLHEYMDSAGNGRVFTLVKGKFPAGERTEHMWLGNATWDGHRYHGILVDEPMWVKELRPGDTVSLAPDQVSDWMVGFDDVMLGGYTIQEIRRRLGRDERAAFDTTLLFRVVADTALLELPRT